MAVIISIIVSVVLAVLLWDRHLTNRRLSEENRRQHETNLELLKRIPMANESEVAECPQALTVEKIADAVRKEGYLPEVEETGVRFNAQGETFYVDAERLPVFFVVKGYNIDPADWEMDILRGAAHSMSDRLVLVKAMISDDGKSLNFFVAAQDRNYESFQANLTYYMHIIEEGQRQMNEEYHRVVDEKRKAAFTAQSIVPPIQHENKVLS